MDGYEATRLIRHSQSKVLDKTIPIIAMTANAMQGDRDKCITSGMDGFVSKPVESEKMLQALQQWLAEHETEESVMEEVITEIAEENEGAQKLIFDYSAMSNRLMNNKNLIRKVVETFSTDMDLQISILKAAIKDKDLTIAAAQAHKIKGASANVSGIALCDLALIAEEACKTEELDTLVELLPVIESNFILLKAAMDEML